MEAARLVFTECGRDPVSGSVGHAEKKGSPFILFPSLVPNSHMSKAHEDNLKPFSQVEGKNPVSQLNLDSWIRFDSLERFFNVCHCLRFRSKKKISSPESRLKSILTVRIRL